MGHQTSGFRRSNHTQTRAFVRWWLKVGNTTRSSLTIRSYSHRTFTKSGLRTLLSSQLSCIPASSNISLDKLDDKGYTAGTAKLLVTHGAFVSWGRGVRGPNRLRDQSLLLRTTGTLSATDQKENYTVLLPTRAPEAHYHGIIPMLYMYKWTWKVEELIRGGANVGLKERWQRAQVQPLHISPPLTSIVLYS